MYADFSEDCTKTILHHGSILHESKKKQKKLKDKQAKKQKEKKSY